MVEHEIHILRQVNHAHIIHLHEVYNTSKVSTAALYVLNEANEEAQPPCV